MRLSVCIEMIFADQELPERVESVARAGFDACEIWGWRGKDIPAFADALRRTGVELTSLVLDTSASLTCPSERARFVDDALHSLDVAGELGARHAVVPVGAERPGASRAEQRFSVLAGLEAVCSAAAARGVRLLLEPLNSRIDHPGSYLTTSDDAASLIRELNRPAVALLFDVYHQQVTEGDLVRHIEEHWDVIAHIQIADVPGRHEPGTGEINYPFVLDRVEALGYQGVIGLEYAPTECAWKSLADVRTLFKGRLFG